MFERRRLLKLNSASLLWNNEIGEVSNLVSCHVCIIRIKGQEKEYTLMSHYKVTNVTEHVAAIRSILYDGMGLNYGSSPAAIVLLFRLSPLQLVKLHASLGTIYHVDKYEEATKALKDALTTVFQNLVLREIPYGGTHKDNCWIKLNTKKGKWKSSFGHGSIEDCNNIILRRSAGN